MNIIWYGIIFLHCLEEEEFFYVELLGPKSEEEVLTLMCQLYSLVQWALLLVERHFFFGEVA